MKCPGCGCNYMDDEKMCPMCEMPNNAIARAAHKMRHFHREKEPDGDYQTTTCAHPDHSEIAERRRKVEQQRAQRLAAERTGKRASRPAASTSRPSVSTAKKPQPSASKIIKIIIGVVVLVNLVIPLLFGVLGELMYYFF